MPRISVITACFNSASTISATIESVLSQRFADIEYIVVDGGSTDGTMDILKSYANRISCIASETDRGIYDALNKGIRLANGDIIAFLHSDDIYAYDNVLGDIAESMTGGVQSCYGDLQYVDRLDTSKVIRHWHAGPYSPENFRRGWMPPHPAFFARRDVYGTHGTFNLEFPIAADYEFMLRVLYRHRISCKYLPNVLVKMRTGGTSAPGLMTTARCMRENYLAWKVNSLPLHPLALFLKPLSKFLQFIPRG